MNKEDNSTGNTGDKEWEEAVQKCKDTNQGIIPFPDNIGLPKKGVNKDEVRPNRIYASKYMTKTGSLKPIPKPIDGTTL